MLYVQSTLAVSQLEIAELYMGQMSHMTHYSWLFFHCRHFDLTNTGVTNWLLHWVAEHKSHL